MAAAKKTQLKSGGDTVKIRDLNPPRELVLDNEYYEYEALAINSIKISCLDTKLEFGYLQEKFIKEQLVRSNYVGYDRLINMWAKCYGFGLNDYWQPHTLSFIYPNRRGYNRTASYKPNRNGAYLIQGYPANVTLSRIIKKATDTMLLCDEVIIQNLGAVKTPHYILVKDKDTRLSLLQAIRQRQQGEPVIMVDETLGDCLKGIENLTEFIVPEVYQYKENVRDRLLNKLGTMTANINKRERVQVGEVNAMVGLCEDYIYSLIDNVNRQFEEYALPFKMEINTSLEELYTNTDQESEDKII